MVYIVLSKKEEEQRLKARKRVKARHAAFRIISIKKYQSERPKMVIMISKKTRKNIPKANDPGRKLQPLRF